MANRFNTPIASQAISAYVPVNMNVLLNELQMVQKRWDENESFGEQVKKTIESIPAMPGDVPFRDQLVSSLTNELNKAVSEETDLGSSSFKRKIESIYNKYSTNADVKTLISNNALYTEKQKKKEVYEKDGRYTPELDIDNQATRVDKNGKLIPYNYQLERAFSDDEYLNPIAKFGSQLKASAQSGRNFVIDAQGNKHTFDFSGKGITRAKVKEVGENFAVSYLNTDVGGQRLKRYIARTGGDQKAAVEMFRQDVISYLEGNVFSETSSGKDFDFAPPDIRKRLQEEQQKQNAPDGNFIRTGDYEIDNGLLTLESPEFVKALDNLAAAKGVTPDKINKVDFLNALNDMRTGIQGTGVMQPTKVKDIGKIETRLFGPDKNNIPFVTENSLVRQGTKLVEIGSDRIAELEKGDYKFNVAGVDVANPKLPGAIVVTATHKDGKKEPLTIYMPNTFANTKIAESVDMLRIVNSSISSPTGTTTPVGGRRFKTADGSQFNAPPGTVLNIRTEYTNPTSTSKGRARQIAELKLQRKDSKGEIKTQVVPLTVDELRMYYTSRIWQGLEEDSEE